jgi:hypothetical protein
MFAVATPSPDQQTTVSHVTGAFAGTIMNSVSYALDPDYTESATVAAGGTSWGTYFCFGGPGRAP